MNAPPISGRGCGKLKSNLSTVDCINILVNNGKLLIETHRTENYRNGQKPRHEPEQEDCKPAAGPGQEAHQLEGVDHHYVPAEDADQ